MAAEKKLNAILICPICLEHYKTPKYLPCLHTFCEGCIQTYIASGFKRGSKKAFDCPVCRSKVAAPAVGCSPEKWATCLPRNFLITGLLEKEKLKQHEKICSWRKKCPQNLFVKIVFIFFA